MENSNNKLIGALIVGAIAGAALGILFAPDKGSKTRSKLLNGAKELAEDFTKKMKEEAMALRNKAEEVEESAEEKANTMMNKEKPAVHNHN
jgi:gas vesicle protein